LKRTIGIIWACVAAVCVLVGSVAAQEGNSPFEPAPAGVKLSGIVECGQGYTSHELYNIKVTLLEVVRGADAWARLREAENANKPAESGFEYVLARVKFEYYARTSPGRCIHKLLPEQFASSSPDGVSYPAANVVSLKPELRGDLSSGNSLEGWVAVVVSKLDSRPLLSYSADAGGAVLHGGGKWFKLY